MGVKLRPLHETTPEELLREIRVRHRKGLPMGVAAVVGRRIQNLARFHFGGWYQAVAAAGLKPVGTSVPKREHKPPRKRLVALTEELLRGGRTGAELERMTGVQVGTIRAKRRRMGILRDERWRRGEGWLAIAKPLMGRLSDHEIARRAGVSKTAVGNARRALGLPAWDTAEGYLQRLDEVPRREVLRLVRARARAGKPMRAGLVEDSRLRRLCDFHFGSWRAAVKAAGFEPEDRIPRYSLRTGGKVRPLTEALLRGPLPNRVLEALTGVSRDTIYLRRRKLGIVRDDRRPDRDWVKGVRAELGKLPDAEIARRVGQTAAVVVQARRELGIPGAPRVSLATRPQVRSRLFAHGKRALDQAMTSLDRRSAFILRERLLRDPPRSQEAIGRRLGIAGTSVGKREHRAVATVLALMELEAASRRRKRSKKGARGMAVRRA